MTEKQRLVVIGNGMAGMRVVDELLASDTEAFDITVFGAEPHGNYNRIMLSPVLAGEKTFAEITTHNLQWYADNNVRLHSGDPVIRIDRNRKQVESARGERLSYDRLLIATGSAPFVIPVPGHKLPGVITFRDIADVDGMLAASQQYQHAVVIGGGLLGLEAANGLLKRGMQVTVVHLLDTLMERQLDKTAAKMLQQELESRGMNFAMQAATAELLGETRVEAIRFKDGSELPADLVVMAAGVRPEITLAKESGLHCERGIMVDDTMQSWDPSIYAVGECVQHRGACYGLVAPLWEQARTCANQLLSHGASSYHGSVLATTLKVTGVSLYSAGEFNGTEYSDDLIYSDPSNGCYKRLVIQNNRLIGVVLYGDAADGPWYFEQILAGNDITAIRDRLIFGRACCEAAPTNAAIAA